MTDKKIFLIAWYFPSFLGGAEKSILEELKRYQNDNYKVFVICFDEGYKIGNFEIENIKGINYGMKNIFKFSRYYTYFFNKKYILNTLKKYTFSKNDLILTQSIIAPIIGDFCFKQDIKYNYYIRDEANLNEFKNYWKGFKWWIKLGKDITDLIVLKNYESSNKRCILNANELISNSKFIAKLLEKKFKKNSLIIYPKIDNAKFEKIKLDKKKQEYILFIGGNNAMKGYDIVLKIAKKLHNEKFLIVGGVNNKSIKENITFIPLQKDIVEIYKQSKLILMPSRCNEAFGRIIIEGNLLNIPSISSDRGGLLEANENGIIINDLENIDLWVEQIKQNFKKK